MEKPTLILSRRAAGMKSRPFWQALGVAVVLVGLSHPAHAAATTWSNTGTDFNSGSSWTGSVAPGTTDTATFSGPAVTQPNLSSSTTIAGVSFSALTSSGYDLTATGGATLNLTSTSSTIAAANTSGTNTIDAHVNLGANAGTNQVINQATGGTLVINGVLSSTNALSTLSLSGGGTITLNGANTYTANTGLATGEKLNLGNATALGTGLLVLTGGVTATIDNTSGSSLSMTNGISLGGGLTFTGGSNLTLGGTVTIVGASRSLTVNGSTLALTGNIGDGGSGFGLTKLGVGALTLSGNNTFSGGLALNAGTLNINSATAIGSGTLTMAGSGTYGIANTSGAAVTLTTANAVTMNSFSFGNASDTAANNLTFGSGQVSYSGPRTITLNGGSALTFGGALVNTSNLVRTLTVSAGTGTTADSVVTFNGFTLATAQTSAQTETINGSGNVTFSGAVVDGGSFANGLTYGGTGVLTLGGTNTYTGATKVASGKLVLTGSIASASTITVGNSAGTSAILSGTGTAHGSVTALAGANTAYFAPGVNTTGTRTDFGNVGTLTIEGNLTLTNGNTFDYDLSSSAASGNDKIVLTGGASTLTLTSVTGLTFNYNLLNGTLDTTNPYALISGFTNTPSLSGITFTSNGLGTYTPVYSVSGGALDVTFTGTVVTPTSAYFNGQGSDLNTTGNYDTTVSSGTAVSGPPGSTTNVFFNANRNSAVTTVNASAPLDVNSITFGTGSGVHSGMTVTGSALTIEATTANGNTLGNGIMVASGGGNNTIAANVNLGNDQNWTVTDASSTLTVSGQVGGAGKALGIAGSGQVALTHSTGNTYTGGTTVSGSSSLQVSNTSGSATGTGALTVLPGGTLLGTGQINASSFAIGSTGTQSHVLVGQTAPGDTSTTTGMTLTGSSASTFTNVSLSFNLNKNNSAESTVLNVGSTAITFNNTVLTLNLEGTGSIPGGTAYLLIDGTSNTQYASLDTFTNALGQLQISDTNLRVAFSNGGDAIGYAQSYLFLNNGDIEVEIVPEPSTWAMMLSGLALLVLWQRRRNKLS